MPKVNALMDEFKRQASIHKAFAYVLAAVAVIMLGYVTYNAAVNGVAAFGFRGGSIRFLFSENPIAATMVLLVNYAFVALMLGVARACYRDHKVWLK